MRPTLFLAALSLLLVSGASHAYDWDDYPVVRSAFEAKALPANTKAVTVSADTHATLEELAERDNIEAINITSGGAVGYLDPLKKMRRLYSLSIRTSDTRSTFKVLAELKDLRSFHLRVH